MNTNNKEALTFDGIKKIILDSGVLDEHDKNVGGDLYSPKGNQELTADALAQYIAPRLLQDNEDTEVKEAPRCGDINCNSTHCVKPSSKVEKLKDVITVDDSKSEDIECTYINNGVCISNQYPGHQCEPPQDNLPQEATSLDDNYQAVQKILLDWNNGRRPLSGEVRDILAWHKAEITKLLQVIEDEVIKQVEHSTNCSIRNDKLKPRGCDCGLGWIIPYQDEQRQILKQIKERYGRN